MSVKYQPTQWRENLNFNESFSITKVTLTNILHRSNIIRVRVTRELYARRGADREHPRQSREPFIISPNPTARFRAGCRQDRGESSPDRPHHTAESGTYFSC